MKCSTMAPWSRCSSVNLMIMKATTFTFKKWESIYVKINHRENLPSSIPPHIGPLLLLRLEVGGATNLSDSSMVSSDRRSVVPMLCRWRDMLVIGCCWSDFVGQVFRRRQLKINMFWVGRNNAIFSSKMRLEIRNVMRSFSTSGGFCHFFFRLRVNHAFRRSFCDKLFSIWIIAPIQVCNSIRCQQKKL